MNQLTTQFKTGILQFDEVPFPLLNDNDVLIRNYYSVISIGTESKTVKDAKRSYIGKAINRKKDVEKVIQLIKVNGLKSTYSAVMNVISTPIGLGYSSAGEVIGVGKNAKGFKVGDFVACGGAGHAEVVSVNKNLCALIPDYVSVKEAAFTTIAAIAIQGIRQANLNLGESCLVIGLGLLGQITSKILEAAGVKVIAIDLSQEKINSATLNGIENVYNRNQNGIESIIDSFTSGNGCDSVIITAATSSLDPVNFAGKVARKRAKVVIVGNVPTGFDREFYYKKELELIMSMSYGPGRYDDNYEVKGIDYPIGYVRWTENRNMISFLELLGSKKIDIKKLVTHTIDFENIVEEYPKILEFPNEYLGVVIEYKKDKDLKSKITNNKTVATNNKPSIGLIGAGNFAQFTVLPNVKDLVKPIGIITNNPINSKYISEKYGFNYCTNDYNEILIDKQIDTVFILTRHNTHAEFVLSSLKNNKNVFVEKPLALNESELEEIKNEYTKHKSLLMVGFNRRFSPLTKEIKKDLPQNLPLSINIRVNTGRTPKEHWTNDPEIGGGRIIGEVCHFIDLAIFLSGSSVKSVFAKSLQDSSNLDNTLSIIMDFENGSIANINYYSNGNNKVPKEYIEVFSNGCIYQINDFKNLTISYESKQKNIKLKIQDKGHKAELVNFIDCVEKGLESPISFNDLYHTSKTVFKIVQSIKENRLVIIE